MNKLLILFAIFSLAASSSLGHNEDVVVSLSVETASIKIGEKEARVSTEAPITSTESEVVTEDATEIPAETSPTTETNDPTCRKVSISREDCNTRSLSQLTTILNRFSILNGMCSCQQSKLVCPSGTNFFNKIDMSLAKNVYNRYCKCGCNNRKQPEAEKENETWQA